MRHWFTGKSSPELEERCTMCEGSGGHEERGEWDDCAWCDGAGYIPTDLGKKLLRLVWHNFKLMLRDAAGDE